MFKSIHKFSAELAGKLPDRNKEIFSIIWNVTAAKMQSGSSNNSMDMRMVIELLAPSMEDLNDSRNGTKEFSVSSQLKDGFSGTFMNEII